MGQTPPFRLSALALVVAAAAVLGGCGRRGPLELPPNTAPQANQDTTTLADKQAATFNNDGPPGVIQSPNQVIQVNQTAAQVAAKPPDHPINAVPVAKPSTFFLDPLL